MKRPPLTLTTAVNHAPGYMPLYQSISNSDQPGVVSSYGMIIHHDDQRLMQPHHTDFKQHSVLVPGSPYHLQGMTYVFETQLNY